MNILTINLSFILLLDRESLEPSTSKAKDK
ncbi:hypothetical protein V6Z12_D12G098200 [Gossypium hirsutum]